jgi:hypothetical protein
MRQCIVPAWAAANWTAIDAEERRLYACAKTKRVKARYVARGEELREAKRALEESVAQDQQKAKALEEGASREQQAAKAYAAQGKELGQAKRASEEAAAQASQKAKAQAPEELRLARLRIDQLTSSLKAANGEVDRLLSLGRRHYDQQRASEPKRPRTGESGSPSRRNQIIETATRTTQQSHEHRSSGYRDSRRY